MPHIKINKYVLFSVSIALVLFIIPFFWLKPGEMDIGGDSSRLYFYDPISYLKTQILYGVTTSGTGGEAASYFVLPFIVLLAGIKHFFSSPTIVIAIVNGLKLGIGYISFYFILKELADRDKQYNEFVLNISSILASLFYMLAPPLIYSGWERSILSHIQIFINPLMFLFLLKYINNRKNIYLVFALLTSFVFSSSFSYFAAPGFFAFFPISVVFLYFYTTCIRKKVFPFIVFFKCVLLFFVLQLFHLGPHVLSLFTANSDINKSVFSTNTIFNLGLDYFAATAANIKVSLSIFGLAQLREISLVSFSYIIFPVVLLLGLFKSKSKLLLITGIFFLITLFFVTANITNTGFTFYKLLFRIPGFKMFRNFYGQWVFAYMFFYGLLFGQALMVIAQRIQKKFFIFIVIAIVGILIKSSLPLLNGSMTQSFNSQSRNIKQSVVMDSAFGQLIQYTKSLPIDGKIISFPLAGPGYQLFAGKDGGAYMGPSIFSYLAGKNDFTGYAGLGPYGQKFIETIRDGDFSSANRMMSLLNIKYIFYNADPYIYDDNFPYYPYDFIRDYMPKTQEEYKKLLPNFPIKEIASSQRGYYYFYTFEDKNYLPHIFTTSNISYVTNPDNVVLNPELNPDIKSAVLNIRDAHNTSDEALLEGNPDNPLQVLQDNYHLHHHEPFTSVELDDYSYPFALFKEKFQLWRNRKNHDRYLDFSLYFMAKRVLELKRWGEATPVLKTTVASPKILDILHANRYNSWESSLLRFESQTNDLISWINANKLSDSLLVVDKIKISEQLSQQKNTLYELLQKSNKSEEDIAYLQNYIETMFSRLYASLDLKKYDPSIFRYNLEIPTQYRNDTFNILLVYPHAELSSNGLNSQTTIQVDIDGKHLEQTIDKASSNVQKIGVLTLGKEGITPLSIVIPTQNQSLQDGLWRASGNASRVGAIDSLALLNTPGDSSGGLNKQILHWAPNKQYVITFDYNTHGANVIFRLFDKVSVNNNRNDIRQHVYADHLLSSNGWSTDQLIVTSAPTSISGYVQFLNNTKKSDSVIDIRNLTVAEINYPEIFLQKKQDVSAPKYIIPTIKFAKINPTKYEINVKDVTGPYILVFLEAYNAQWKLININQDANGFPAGVMRALGSALSTLSSLMGKKMLDDQSVAASYFGETVNEGVHSNSFLDMRNFLSWGKQPIAEKTHVRANSYANAWIIHPEDMQQRSSYTLILETASQNYFYIYLGISTMTAMGILIYGIIIIFKNRT